MKRWSTIEGKTIKESSKTCFSTKKTSWNIKSLHPNWGCPKGMGNKNSFWKKYQKSLLKTSRIRLNTSLKSKNKRRKSQKKMMRLKNCLQPKRQRRKAERAHSLQFHRDLLKHQNRRYRIDRFKCYCCVVCTHHQKNQKNHNLTALTRQMIVLLMIHK